MNYLQQHRLINNEKPVTTFFNYVRYLQIKFMQPDVEKVYTFQIYKSRSADYEA